MSEAKEEKRLAQGRKAGNRCQSTALNCNLLVPSAWESGNPAQRSAGGAVR